MISKEFIDSSLIKTVFLYISIVLPGIILFIQIVFRLYMGRRLVKLPTLNGLFYGFMAIVFFVVGVQMLLRYLFDISTEIEGISILLFSFVFILGGNISSSRLASKGVFSFSILPHCIPWEKISRYSLNQRRLFFGVEQSTDKCHEKFVTIEYVIGKSVAIETELNKVIKQRSCIDAENI